MWFDVVVVVVVFVAVAAAAILVDMFARGFSFHRSVLLSSYAFCGTSCKCILPTWHILLQNIQFSAIWIILSWMLK